MQLKASAPGSLMLLGEYAVLYGKPALVCALDKRIVVTLTPRNDKQIYLESALGSHITSIDELKIEKPFQFVLGVLQQYQAKLKRGCHLNISADFSDQVGFGSSAAVTVAALAALVKWLNVKITPLDLVRQGCRVVRLIQGAGSGADIAASVYGGIVGYQAQPLAVEKFSVTHPLVAWYSGYKTPTADAIKRVQSRFAAYPNLFRHLCHSIGQGVFEGMQMIRKEEWHKLGEILNIQQGLMESLGVSTPVLHHMAATLREQNDIKGAKISGSGLGDCIIGLGTVTDEEILKHNPSSAKLIPIAITLQGVQCDKI